MAIYELDAALRKDVGKGASRRLRRENFVPAIVYGAGKPVENLQLGVHQLARALKHESFYSHIITLNVDGAKQQAVLKALHRHPFKPVVLHADFLRISENEKITMHVPLHFIGADECPGHKDGGVITHMRNELEVHCLPRDLPEYIEVDLSTLELGHSVHLSQIKLPKGVEIHGFDEDHDHAVASVAISRAAIAEEQEEAAAESQSSESAADAEGDKE